MPPSVPHSRSLPCFILPESLIRSRNRVTHHRNEAPWSGQRESLLGVLPTVKVVHPGNTPFRERVSILPSVRRRAGQGSRGVRANWWNRGRNLVERSVPESYRKGGTETRFLVLSNRTSGSFHGDCCEKKTDFLRVVVACFRRLRRSELGLQLGCVQREIGEYCHSR
jgi:hypothetical protein